MKVRIPLGSLRLLSAIAAGASPILFSVAAVTVVATNCQKAQAQFQVPPSTPAAPGNSGSTVQTPPAMQGGPAAPGLLPSQNPSPAVVQPAAVSQPVVPGSNSMLQPGVYQSNMDRSKVQPASNLQFAESSDPTVSVPVDPNMSGDDLYRMGIEALTAQNKKAALEYFSAAWKKQAEMDPALRVQLKDKLTLLNQAPARPEPIAAGEVPPGVQALNQEQALLRQKMFREVTTEIAESERMVTAQPMEALDRLKSLRQRVSQSNIEGGARKEYLAMVDRVINNVDAYIKQNQASINQQIRNDQVEKSLIADAANQARIDSEIQRLVDEFNQLNKDQRFAEAEIVAKKVGELAPNTELAVTMLTKARIARRANDAESVQQMKADGFLDVMHSTELAAVAIDPDLPLILTPEDIMRNNRRKSDDNIEILPAERVIREKLRESVSVSFQGRPLSYALDTISQMTGIPIVADPVGLSTEGLTLDQPVSLELNGNSVSLKSALNLLLEPLNLTYVVKDEVLKVTSRQTVQKKRETKTYPVGDLVIPIPNFTAGNASAYSAALESAYQTQTGYALVQNQSATTGARIGGGAMGIDPTTGALAQAMPNGFAPGMGSPLPGMPVGGMGGTANGFGGNGFGAGNAPGGGGANADFGSLITLIQDVIPGEWDTDDTITPFASNLSIIVNAPLETHEDIQALLKQLRSLQNLQVTIEIRFITLSDNFFERMGVDFDFNIDDNNSTRPGLSGVGLQREDAGPSTSFGLTAGIGGFDAAAPATADLDLQFRQNSFATSTPAFGAFDNNVGASLGFAILSDIEMFFFLNAAQGDSRTNVMQAPKVTMFDGQSASVTDGASVPFVMGLQPVVGDFAVAQQPIIGILHDGTQLTVQSVVSPDKRFVRMTMSPSFTSVRDRDRTFTFTGSTSTDTGNTVTGPNGQPLPDNDNETRQFAGSTVQLPTLATTSILTTVVVPDGGTILLGGIKRLSEGRTEQGVPMLSKIPYVNRLFSNVGVGRTANTFMMTVTPRIIIPEEEEERVLGTSAMP